MQDIFIKRLIELMEEKDMSQVALAKLIGTSNVTISRYINGERKPRIEIVSKIASVFNTSIDYLLGFSDNKNMYSSNINEKSLNIQNELKSIGISNELSRSQIDMIKKILEANKNIILDVHDNNSTKKTS